jgi:predicted ATPase
MTDPVRILHRRDFQHLLDALASRGYRIVGPTVRDGAIVYDEIHDASDLPEGWTDRQAAARIAWKSAMMPHCSAT